MKIWIGRILLVFAIFTLGYGVGQKVGFRSAKAQVLPTQRVPAEPTSIDKVLVYYLHTPYRCETCTSIEASAKAVVETQFAAELTTGAVEWRTADYLEREDLAERYDISASVVVVVDVEDGREVAFERLDDVWTLYDQPDAFANYVAGTIRRFQETSP